MNKQIIKKKQKIKIFSFLIKNIKADQKIFLKYELFLIIKNSILFENIQKELNQIENK